MLSAMALSLALTLCPFPSDSLQSFVVEQGISMTAEEVLVSPFLSDNDTASTRWVCTLRVADRHMTVVYESLGQAKLELWPVLVRLVAQCETLRNAPELESWCKAVGMDPDSRRAERVFSLVNRQCGDLEGLLGTQQTARILNIVGTQ